MVRRPLFFACLSFSSAVFISFHFGLLAALISIGAFFAVFRKRYLRDYRVQGTIILVFYCFSALNFQIYERNCRGLDESLGKKVEAEAVITEVRIKEGSFGSFAKITAKVGAVDGRDNVKGPFGRDDLITVNIYGDRGYSGEGDLLIPGNHAVISGVLEEPDGRRNPACFDYAMHLRTKGVYYTMDEALLISVTEMRTLQGSLHRIKEEFTEGMARCGGEDAAGLARGIMFGEKEDIDEDVLEEFQKNGTAHILAVSGLHIGMIYAFIYRLWRGRKGRLFFFTVTLLLCSYAVIASFSPSVVRAVFMVELHLLAKLLNRRYDLASAAFLAAMVMMTGNPLELFNAGFQMSFTAVLTLAALLPYINRVYNGVLAAGAAVQAGLTPYIMYVFNYFSIASIFINVPVIFLAGLIVPICFSTLIIMMFTDGIFEITAKPVYGLCTIMEHLNSAACIDGRTSFDAESPSMFFMAFYYLALLFFLSEEGRIMIIRRKKGILAAMTALILIMSMAAGKAVKTGFEDCDLIFVDVGQGDCMHIRTDEGGNYLVDGGGSHDYDVGRKTLKPYLLKNGTDSIDGAFVSHLHTDHYKGIAELCGEGMVDKLFVYEGYREREDDILRDTSMKREDIVYLEKGQEVRLGGDAKAEILWPEGRSDYGGMMGGEADENDMSLILKVHVKGWSFIATGDIDSECEEELSAIYGRDLASDILKVSHHGSRFSSSETFIDDVDPVWAVIQTGRNTYGHPHAEVIEKLEERGIEVFRNDLDGAVGFDLDGGPEAVTVR